jgi:hypothetical protein
MRRSRPPRGCCAIRKENDTMRQEERKGEKTREMKY